MGRSFLFITFCRQISKFTKMTGIEASESFFDKMVFFYSSVM